MLSGKGENGQNKNGEKRYKEIRNEIGEGYTKGENIK